MVLYSRRYAKTDSKQVGHLRQVQKSHGLNGMCIQLQQRFWCATEQMFRIRHTTWEANAPLKKQVLAGLLLGVKVLPAIPMLMQSTMAHQRNFATNKV